MIKENEVLKPIKNHILTELNHLTLRKVPRELDSQMK